MTNDKCHCGKKETLNHILNGCKVALEQGRYTFRHDSVLSYIAKCLNKNKFNCYVDIDGYQTPAGGTLPPNIIVSTLRPDIVIEDTRKKTLTVLELTVPGEGRIKESNRLKFEKYQHLLSDIKTHTVSVLPFEVGSNTGFVSRDNKDTLHKLHKFCDKEVKLKHFIKNISAIVGLSSYNIFNCRNDKNWEKPSVGSLMN